MQPRAAAQWGEKLALMKALREVAVKENRLKRTLFIFSCFLHSLPPPSNVRDHEAREYKGRRFMNSPNKEDSNK